MKAAPPTDALYATLAEFRYRLRRFLAFSEQAAEAAGLTPRQHQALLAIRAHPGPGLTVGQLAERLGLRPHSAVELLDRLAEAGLIRRTPDPADRRRMRVTLTPAASARLAALSTTHVEELRRLRPLLVQLLDRLDAPDDGRTKKNSKGGEAAPPGPRHSESTIDTPSGRRRRPA